MNDFAAHRAIQTAQRVYDAMAPDDDEDQLAGDLTDAIDLLTRARDILRANRKSPDLEAMHDLIQDSHADVIHALTEVRDRWMAEP